MKQVMFVQGGGAGAHRADARLAASLQRALGSDYAVDFPAMPHEHSPDYATWKQALATFIAALADGAVLVAHSVGAPILASLLSESASGPALGGLFLVAAPFVGRGGWQIEEYALPENLGALLPQGVPVFLYHGREDETVPFAHLALYAEAIPQAKVRALDGRDHQLNDDLSEVAADIRDLAGR
jgi:predicted alpha/beta hydrolase family esterase